MVRQLHGIYYLIFKAKLNISLSSANIYGFSIIMGFSDGVMKVIQDHQLAFVIQLIL